MKKTMLKGLPIYSFPSLLVAACLCVTVPAHAQSNLVLFISQPGDYIGGGQTYITTNTSDFSFSSSPNLVTVAAFGYTFWIGGPAGSNLMVGLYTNSARFNDRQPGLDISGNGRGCNTDCGAFQVYEIHTNLSGQIDRFWITFSNRCECYDAPMSGEIRYNLLLVPSSIVSQSLDTNVLAGQSISLSVVPAGTAPFTYRWMFENVNISGGTSQILTINNAQTANEGIYRVVVANAAGSVTSAPVSVRSCR